MGDSAEEFVLIHALGRERLLVLSCGRQIRSEYYFLARWEAVESVSLFSTDQCQINL